MILLIFLGITFFIQLFAASWYDLAKKTGDNKKAFKHKMICSAIYIADILLCSAINKSFFNIYSSIFMVAFLLLFTGDILEAKLKAKANLISAITKTLSYAGLSCAIIYKNISLFKEIFFKRLTINISVCAITIIVFAIFILKAKEKLYLPSGIITAIFTVQSIFLGIPLQQSNVAVHQTASCAVIMGALAIAFSTILMIFDKKSKKSLATINSYYFGLMILACSVAIL